MVFILILMTPFLVLYQRYIIKYERYRKYIRELRKRGIKLDREIRLSEQLNYDKFKEQINDRRKFED